MPPVRSLIAWTLVLVVPLGMFSSADGQLPRSADDVGGGGSTESTGQPSQLDGAGAGALKQGAAPRAPGEAPDGKGTAGGGDDLGELGDLLKADLTQLSNTEISAPEFTESVTTVARQETTVGRSPAAAFVITNEMIRRSGARSIPEALRMAPGVQVARIDANKWAVSIRGFNDRFANKLLVLIDGRSVYTPLFAGVFWDVQDVLLEDVHQIEVIRGPGAAEWGANAVNGVINIITKRAAETRGLYAEAGAGSEREFTSARIGGQSGNVAWRAYGKWFDRDAGFSPVGLAGDDWNQTRFGFRTDWEASRWDRLTVQGDIYDGTASNAQTVPIPQSPFQFGTRARQGLAGGNSLIRWTHEIDDTSDWALQMYYDRTEREILPFDFREDRDTVDVDFQHRFRWHPRHAVLWGAGYRNTRDRIRNAWHLRFLPAERAVDTFSTFVQDQITLREELVYLTAGSRFSWNDYTGFEYQPSLRLLYTPSSRRTLWTSVARAVRVPSRANDDVHSLTAPSAVPGLFPNIRGDRGIESEQLLAWGAGLRSAPSDDLYWDLAVFYHHYTDLQTIRQGAPGPDPVTGVFALPLTFFNGADGDAYGFELSATWRIHEQWTLRGWYTLLQLHVQADPRQAPAALNIPGQSPEQQAYVQSSWDLGRDWQLDLIGRFVDRLPAEGVAGYFGLDLRLAWRPLDDVEFSLVGRNLLDASHPEFGDDVFSGVPATEVQREVYGLATWRY